MKGSRMSIRLFTVALLLITYDYAICNKVGTLCCEGFTDEDKVPCDMVQPFGQYEMIKFSNNITKQPLHMWSTFVPRERTSSSEKPWLDCGSDYSPQLNATCDQFCKTNFGQCAGDITYCSSYPCVTGNSFCYCKSAFGDYVTWGAIAPESPRSLVFNVTCGPLVGGINSARRDLQSLSSTTPNPEFSWEVTELNDLVIYFREKGMKSISVQCMEKGKAWTCGSDSLVCPTTLNDVCISNQVLAITVLDGNLSSSQVLRCKQALAGKCDFVTDTWSDVMSFNNYDCPGNYIKVLFVMVKWIGILSMIALVLRIIRYVVLILWPIVSYPMVCVKWMADMRKPKIYTMTKRGITAMLKPEEDEESPPPMRFKPNPKLYVFLFVLVLVPLSHQASSGKYSCVSSIPIIGASYSDTQVSDGVVSASISFSLVGTATKGLTTCYDFIDPKNNQSYATLYISYKRHQTVQTMTLEDYTAGYEVKTYSRLRCPGEGGCSTNGNCPTVSTTDKNPNNQLSVESEDYPGISKCGNGAGGFSFGCFLNQPTCIYTRGVISTAGSFPYEVWSTLGSVSHSPELEVVIMSYGSVIANYTTIGTSKQQVTPDFSIQIDGNFNGMSSTFANYGVIRNLGNGTSWFAPFSAKGAPVSGTLNDIQATTYFNTTTYGIRTLSYPINFIYAANIFGTLSYYSDGSANYTYTKSGINNVLPTYKKFPITIDDNVWNFADRLMKTENMNPGTLQFRIASMKNYTVSTIATIPCPTDIEAVSYGGCYGCLSKAYVSLKIVNRCASGQVSVQYFLDDGKHNILTDALITRSFELEDYGTYIYNITFNPWRVDISAVLCIYTAIARRCTAFQGIFPTDVVLPNTTIGNDGGVVDKNNATESDPTWLEELKNKGKSALSSIGSLSSLGSSITGWIEIIVVVVGALALTYVLVMLFVVFKPFTLISSAARKIKKSQIQKQGSPLPITKSKTMRKRLVSGSFTNPASE